MKIEIGEKNCLLVFLDSDDVKRLHLDGENIVYTDESTRKIINSVYREAALSIGFVPENADSRVIELLPFNDGSMLMCFSFKSKRPKLKVIAKLKERHSVYEFSCESDFKRYLESSCFTEKQKNAEVFESSGKYRLLISDSSQKEENLLGEFALKIGSPLAVSKTREYWTKICENSQ